MSNKKKKKNTGQGTEEKEKSSLKRAMNASKAADANRRRQAVAAAQGGQQTEKRGGWREYFKGVKIETKKVVWPTRQELISYTIVVLFTCAFFGVMIWGVDSAFLAALRKIVEIPY
ncbi:MAG: preprotein translocase subunit SecE [Clostridiales Family XIII bacterium]|jgi:preprotein translocase subunit SecE|nr:preprotein translocase subunit SecE [Clostridiales Family XIII bacterium]